ncbi:acetyl-CoA carboxylase biotin carboxylase subunit [Lactobacillus sp. DCY120]|uniref:Acetyl-CoA carboxylase biotin carboxylase subunit n=1 Tax=Bombilactobacillus apium TaxID=2675299 RepID=A0A850R2V8_9LACO|nr:acetyl-CoA carboxylase biotin carboxylase subunit [Bombilactobacillus apium]NVY96690.1 acetyl-CoA carboxylase biotin carboxylase subunit [Bombilactobacillus apium]
MFEKVLIANRGEIALRIIRALKELEVSSVAVYSTADRKARYVQEADEAICIGGPQPASSYLNMENIISAAVLTGAQAIHPGYGFLSESAEFAQLCVECNLKFIGPDPKTISLMGDKANARQTMQQNKIPVIPGSNGFVEDLTEIQTIAQEVGLPVMLKAAAGGGGKGIRKVTEFDQLAPALAAAQKEAQISFGDQRMYLEKVVSPAKHIEVQVIADQFHQVVAFPERDCSLQRKQQKVLEESPCALLTPAERQQLQKLAVQAMKAINYENAGTLEFLMDQQHNFYFMEMNTRIQVEHPITEEVSGVDLIKEQIRVAAGEKLAFKQSEITVHGAAIEARINAEDPAHGFRPQAGLVRKMNLPGGLGIRIESGIVAGDQVSPFYDSMIIKIIAHADQRPVAIRRLENALQEFEVDDLVTNQRFLAELLEQPEVQKGTYLTTYIDQKFGAQFEREQEAKEEQTHED